MYGRILVPLKYHVCEHVKNCSATVTAFFWGWTWTSSSISWSSFSKQSKFMGFPSHFHLMVPPMCPVSPEITMAVAWHFWNRPVGIVFCLLRFEDGVLKFSDISIWSESRYDNISISCIISFFWDIRACEKSVYFSLNKNFVSLTLKHHYNVSVS